jgi:hypothetical protein
MTEAPSALNRATTESAVATARPRQPLNPRATNLVYQSLAKDIAVFEIALGEFEHGWTGRCGPRAIATHSL